MSIKATLKPFVPPIVWTAARRAVKPRRITTEHASAASDVFASQDSYKIDFSRVSFGGSNYFVPKYAAHRPACSAILDGRLFEPQTHDLVARLLKDMGGSMVHAGTFFGDMLPSFSKACSGTIFAFEPVLENFVLAKLTVDSNRLDNVMIYNAGLGDRVSVSHVDTGADAASHNGGSSQISDSGQQTNLCTIDSLDIQDLSIIQLDVEGFELQALKGAVASIKKHDPVIMIEDNNDSCRGFLESIGYRSVMSIPGLTIWASDARSALFDASV